MINVFYITPGYRGKDEEIFAQGLIFFNLLNDFCISLDLKHLINIVYVKQGKIKTQERRMRSMVTVS